MPVEPSQRQRDASRKNGAKSAGPKTAAGKARSSQNALTYGGHALVHRPAGEPLELARRLEQGLIERYDASSPGELEVVRGMAKDVVRMKRLAAAEEAACSLAKLKVGRSMEDNLQLTKILGVRRHWQTLATAAENAKFDFAKRRTMREVDEIERLTKIAHGLLDMQGVNIDTSIEGGHALVGHVMDLQQATTAIDQVNALIEVARGAIDYLTLQEKRLVEQETQRLTCEDALADVPDDETVKRFDRYRRALESSMLRRIEIMKGLKELGMITLGNSDPEIIE